MPDCEERSAASVICNAFFPSSSVHAEDIHLADAIQVRGSLPVSGTLFPQHAFERRKINGIPDVGHEFCANALFGIGSDINPDKLRR
jgi:hypothetical protein